MRERKRRYDISECGEETDQEHGERFVESGVGRDEEIHNGAKNRQEGRKEGSEIGAELRSTEEEQDRCVFGVSFSVPVAGVATVWSCEKRDWRSSGAM